MRAQSHSPVPPAAPAPIRAGRPSPRRIGATPALSWLRAVRTEIARGGELTPAVSGELKRLALESAEEGEACLALECLLARGVAQHEQAALEARAFALARSPNVFVALRALRQLRRCARRDLVLDHEVGRLLLALWSRAHGGLRRRIAALVHD